MIGFSLLDLPTVVGQAKRGVTSWDNFESYNTTSDFLGNQDAGIGWGGPWVTSHPNVISGRLLNGRVEQFVIMSGSCACARKIYLNPNWNNIRIGMRFLMTNNEATLRGPILAGGFPRDFYLGFCAGTTGILSDNRPKHFIGLDWTASAGYTFDPGNHVYNLNGGTLSQAVINIGGNTTSGNNSFGHSSIQISNNSPTGNIIQATILDIKKSGINSNYTFELFGNDGGTANNFDSDLFLNHMTVVPLPQSEFAGAYVSSLNAGLAPISGIVNEAANGILDSLNLYWNSTGVQFHIYEVAVNRIS
jgi:hypothetical protein